MRTTQILEDIFEDSFNIVIIKHTPISFLKNLKTIQFIHLHIEIAKVLNVYVKTKDFQKCKTIEDLATLINNKVKNKMEKELSYSLDGSVFMDREEIMDQLDGSQDIIYTGEPIKKIHSDFISADTILGNIADEANESGGEFSDPYCEELTSLSREKHSELQLLICEFLSKNIGEPSFFGIKNVKKITIEEFEDDEPK